MGRRNQNPHQTVNFLSSNTDKTYPNQIQNFRKSYIGFCNLRRYCNILGTGTVKGLGKM